MIIVPCQQIELRISSLYSATLSQRNAYICFGHNIERGLNGQM